MQHRALVLALPLFLVLIMAPGAEAQDGARARDKRLRIEAMDLELDFRQSEEEWAPQPRMGQREELSLLLRRERPGSPALLARLRRYPPASQDSKSEEAPRAESCSAITAQLEQEFDLHIASIALHRRFYTLALGARGVAACRVMADGSTISLWVTGPPDGPFESSQAADIVEAFLDYSGIGKASPNPSALPPPPEDEEGGELHTRFTARLRYVRARGDRSTDLSDRAMFSNHIVASSGAGLLRRWMSLEVGSGSTSKGGFAYELAFSPLGYALHPARGVALGALIGTGVDGVSGGRLLFSADLRASLFAKLGSQEDFFFARLDHLWLHRDARENGSSHALLAGDELRAEIGIRARIQGMGLSVALRTEEMMAEQFWGGSLGLGFR